MIFLFGSFWPCRCKAGHLTCYKLGDFQLFNLLKLDSCCFPLFGQIKSEKPRINVELFWQRAGEIFFQRLNNWDACENRYSWLLLSFMLFSFRPISATRSMFGCSVSTRKVWCKPKFWAVCKKQWRQKNTWPYKNSCQGNPNSSQPVIQLISVAKIWKIGGIPLHKSNQNFFSFQQSHK